VGIIDPEGMRKGSAKNDRSNNTINTIGKNERAYSTITGSFFSSKMRPFDLRNNKYPPQITPVTTVATKRKKEKSKSIIYIFIV
jgi:hypothetical protein